MGGVGPVTTFSQGGDFFSHQSPFSFPKRPGPAGCHPLFGTAGAASTSRFLGEVYNSAPLSAGHPLRLNFFIYAGPGGGSGAWGHATLYRYPENLAGCLGFYVLHVPSASSQWGTPAGRIQRAGCPK